MTLQMRQFNPDGSPDESVGPGGEKVTNLADGFMAEFRAATPALQDRLREDGITDDITQEAYLSWNTFDSLQALPDATSVASFTSQYGASVNGDGFSGRVELVRFDASGTLVSNVEVRPGTVNGHVRVTQQPDGKVVVLDVSDNPDTAGQITRYQLDGTLDPTFGTNGVVNTANDAFRAMGVASAADGTLLVTANTQVNWYDGATELVAHRTASPERRRDARRGLRRWGGSLRICRPAGRGCGCHAGRIGNRHSGVVGLARHQFTAGADFAARGRRGYLRSALARRLYPQPLSHSARDHRPGTDPGATDPAAGDPGATDSFDRFLGCNREPCRRFIGSERRPVDVLPTLLGFIRGG